VLLEPDKPKTRWRGIVIGHLLLYVILIVTIFVADSYFYNSGDALIVYLSAALLTLFSYLINKLNVPRKAFMLTLMISPGILLVFFIIMVNLLMMLGVVHE
jgi:hypothetical protein